MALEGNYKLLRAKALVFIVLALLLSLWAVPVHAQSLPPIPHAFYGKVTINGEAAPVGTIVTAKVGGVECGSYTVKVAGQYGDRPHADNLVVTHKDIHGGDTINFYVDGVDTTQTATFEAGGGPTELDLSVTIAIPTVTTSAATSATITAPTVTTSAATSVTTTSATLNGNLSSLGTPSSVSVSFEWGTSTGYGSGTTAQMLTSTGSFSAALSGLAPATTYHFRAKVVNSSTSYGLDTSFTTTAVVAAGGGTTLIAGKIDTQGIMTQSVTVKSEDGISRLTIDKDVKALDKEGNPLSLITIAPIAEPPLLPEDANVIGLIYDFRPDGATFAPPITLNYSYDPSDIPDGVNEEDLVIAYYDKDAAKWVELESTVNTATNSVTAKVSHFTAFAILGYKVVVPSAAAPAAFTLSSLTISPTEVNIGETVTISILVANTGGQSASYKVILKIGGAVEAISEKEVAAGATERFSFSTTKNVAGTYSVDVSGLTGSFAVKEAPPVVSAPSPPSESQASPPAQPAPPPAPPAKALINWPIIGGIIAAVVVVALLIFSLARRRA